MSNKLLHTPEGVRDIYGDESAKKQHMLKQLRGLLASYGYESIETPTFEYFDIFGSEMTTTRSSELFKLADREGHTLVLRPDITPAVARAVSKYFDVAERPAKVFYQGNVFVNNSRYRGRLRESTQLGGEFIGENSIYADSEILAIVVKSLQRVGLEHFQISIGHVDLFKGLVEAAGLDQEQIAQLQLLVHNKNIYAVEAFLQEQQLPAELIKLFTALMRMYATPADWAFAVELAQGYPKVCEALTYLQKLYKVLSLHGVDKYITFEMSLISTHEYYTGILFKGYTFGSGEPIVLGGRYDNLLSHFGVQAPAIGFALMADQLLFALDRQDIDTRQPKEREAILFTEARLAEAIELSEAKRAEGKRITMVAMDLSAKSLEAYKAAYAQMQLSILD